MSNAGKVLIGSIRSPDRTVYINTDDLIAYLNALKLDIYEDNQNGVNAGEIALLNKLVKVVTSQRDEFKIA